MSILVGELVRMLLESGNFWFYRFQFIFVITMPSGKNSSRSGIVCADV